jgi:hypothetical protein
MTTTASARTWVLNFLCETGEELRYGRLETEDSNWEIYRKGTRPGKHTKSY